MESLPRTPNEHDFCACGGTFVRSRHHPGRRCGFHGHAEATVEIAGVLPDGRHVWLVPGEVVESISDALEPMVTRLVREEIDRAAS